MLKVRNAVINDKESVCIFLQKYFISDDKCRWNKIFENTFCVDESPGIILEDDKGAIFGFLGTIFSEQKIGNNIIKVCHLSSWAVDEKARGKGIKMISSLVKRDDLLLLDLSANEASRRIFEFYKFNSLERCEYVFIPFPIINLFKYRFYYNEDIDIEALSQNNLKIFNEFKGGCTKMCLVKCMNKKVFIVYNLIKRKNLSFIEILYISDINNKNLKSILQHISFKEYSFGCIIDSRFIGNVSGYKYINNIKHKIYRNNYKFNIDLSNISNIYSEKNLFCM